jgi:hypothetical protein
MLQIYTAERVNENKVNINYATNRNRKRAIAILMVQLLAPFENQLKAKVLCKWFLMNF